MTQEDGTRSLVGLEDAPDGDLELARSLVRRRSQADDARPDRTEGSAGLASSVPSTCGRRPNFPQIEVKNCSH